MLPRTLEVSARRWLRVMALCAPFLAPNVFDVVYDPINRDWTVATFGCGCPDLDGTDRFDANEFNAVLWTLVFSASAFTWWVGCHAIVQSESPVTLVGFPIGGIAWMCVYHYARGIWL